MSSSPAAVHRPRTTASAGVLILAATGITLVLWASAFVGIRYTLTWFSPGALALLRCGVATVVMTAIWLFASRRSGTPALLPERHEWPWYLLFGFLSVVVYNVALNMGERTVTAGTASFLITQIPVVSTVLAAVLIGERTSRLGALGIGVGILGTLVMLLADQEGLQVNVGTALVLAAVVGESLYFVLGHGMLTRQGPLRFNVFVAIPGTLMLLPWTGELITTLRTAPAQAIWVAVYLGVFPTCLAFLLWSYCLSRSSVSRTTAAVYLLPFLTILIAAVWLTEWPSPQSLIGGLIALCGGVVTHLAKQGKPNFPEQLGTRG
ncbi:MAG: DMT family transporter [Pseudonocardiaceae bacterium]